MDRYFDLDAATDGDGSELTPWNASSFIAKMNNQLDAGDVVYIKGMHDYGIGVNLEIQGIGGGFTLKNWGNTPPRIRIDNLILFSTDITMERLVFGFVSSGGIGGAGNFKAYSCRFMNGQNYAFHESAYLYGCTIIGSGVLSSSGSRIVEIYDSIIDMGYISYVAPTTDHCLFTFTPSDGVHTNYQFNWTPPTWPAWNADKEEWKQETILVGVNTPPAPGTPPYTGYATGPWGKPRITIGALYMWQDCIDARIDANLMATLKTITEANGYNTNIGTVERPRKDIAINNRYPFTMVIQMEPDEVEQWAHLRDDTLNYIIWHLDGKSDKGESVDTEFIRRLRNVSADIAKALRVDPSRGQLAQNTKIIRSGFGFFMDAPNVIEPGAYTLVEIERVIDPNNPYNLAP